MPAQLETSVNAGTQDISTHKHKNLLMYVNMMLRHSHNKFTQRHRYPHIPAHLFTDTQRHTRKHTPAHVQADTCLDLQVCGTYTFTGSLEQDMHGDREAA